VEFAILTLKLVVTVLLTKSVLLEQMANLDANVPKDLTVIQLITFVEVLSVTPKSLLLVPSQKSVKLLHSATSVVFVPMVSSVELVDSVLEDPNSAMTPTVLLVLNLTPNPRNVWFLDLVIPAILMLVILVNEKSVCYILLANIILANALLEKDVILLQKFA